MSARNVDLYDLCIVGAGLIGSAAARHATLISPDSRVILVGPKEPKDRLECKRGIFGAHFDEARITRTLESDPVWAELTKRSVARYREIEKKSGVKFFTDVGFMAVFVKNSILGRKAKQNVQDLDTAVQILTKSEVGQRFPFLSISDDSEAVLEIRDAGIVNPRAQIAAQQTLARRQGCDVIDDVVDRVVELAAAEEVGGPKRMKVTTASGQEIIARRVLLTTGAFTGFRDLLPPGKTLDTKLASFTAVLVEISATDAERLKDMPPVLVYNDDEPRRHNSILPPVKYPNGKYYLKLGQGAEHERELKTAGEVAKWYITRGDSTLYRALSNKLLSVVKGVTPLSVHGDGCVLTRTPTGQLYCDLVTPSLGVTVGGNGLAAKSADEIGRMGARMIIAGQWDHHLPREKFTARFKVDTSKL